MTVRGDESAIIDYHVEIETINFIIAGIASCVFFNIIFFLSQLVSLVCAPPLSTKHETERVFSVPELGKWGQ
jgi:hypothetical protein